jgi:hypothetical protein
MGAVDPQVTQEYQCMSVLPNGENAIGKDTHVRYRTCVLKNPPFGRPSIDPADII